MNLSKFSRQKNIGERTFSRTWFYRSIVDRPPNSAVLDRTTIWQETRRKGTYLHSLWLATMGNKPSYFLPGLIGFFARSKQTSDLRNHYFFTILTRVEGLIDLDLKLVHYGRNYSPDCRSLFARRYSLGAMNASIMIKYCRKD
ncbi:uncharacterized protein LOC113218555 [Apis mellifera]|uniref:Uncharacterized protein LOC113218555 n=1 Tax=Apis mellifera TaxID=7460 RepID=A0A7M7KZL3_APIME|nr:uncharacterized protein LOC113218555 [Apis mellifera]|eukprot:XP_026295411.1 uncharacterized protein LOC113218555 [Apis mellifera]